MRIADVMNADWGNAMQTVAPLALSMAQGIRSGQGAQAYMGQGLAAMMQQAEARREREAAEKLDGMLGGMNLSPTERALIETMDLRGKQSYLAQLMARQRAGAGGGGPSQADMVNSYLGNVMAGPAPSQAPSGDFIAPSGNLSFGTKGSAGPTPQLRSTGEGVEPSMLRNGQPGTIAPMMMPPAAPAMPADEMPIRMPNEPQGSRVFQFASQPQEAPQPGVDPMVERLQAEERRLLSQYDRVSQDPNRPPGALKELASRIERVRKVMPEQAKTPDVSAKEQQIARIMESGYSREQAISVVDGINEITPTGELMNRITGDIVGAPPPTGATASETGGVDLSFDSTVPTTGANYTGAFGPTGFAAQAGNIAADAVGAPLPAPDIQRAQTAVSNVALQTVTTLQESFPGRASVQLMNKLEEVAARPAQLLRGDQRSRDIMEQTADMIEGFILQEQRKIENPRGYTMAQRAEARAKIDQLGPLLANYRAILGQLGGASSVSPDDVQLMEQLLNDG